MISEHATYRLFADEKKTILIIEFESSARPEELQKYLYLNHNRFESAEAFEAWRKKK